MKIALAMLLIFCLLLTGCAGRQVEEELLVIVLSVDQTETGDIKIAVKVPANASATGDSAHQEISQDGYLLLQAVGRSFADAVSMLNATTPRRVNFSPVREVVIGESAAGREDFQQILRQIDAIPRFRCSAAVIICRGEALAFAEQQKPYVGMRLSRYAENTLANYAGKGFTPSTDLCAGLRDLGCGFQDPLFILGALNTFSNDQPLDESNSLNAYAGRLPRKSMEAVEMFGAAATNGVCVSGYLSGYEMALIHLLGGHVEALLLEIDGRQLQITALGPARLSVDLSARPVRLSAALQCEAHYSPGDPPDEAQVQARLQRDIFALIRRLQQLGCDGLGFGNIAVRQFSTVQGWEALDWRGLYAQAEASVQAKVRFRVK